MISTQQLYGQLAKALIHEEWLRVLHHAAASIQYCLGVISMEKALYCSFWRAVTFAKDSYVHVYFYKIVLVCR